MIGSQLGWWWWSEAGRGRWAGECHTGPSESHARPPGELDSSGQMITDPPDGPDLVFLLSASMTACRYDVCSGYVDRVYRIKRRS